MSRNPRVKFDLAAAALALDPDSLVAMFREPALVLDDGGRILAANDPARRFFDPPDDLVGRPVADFLQEDTLPLVPDSAPRRESVRFRRSGEEARRGTIDISSLPTSSRSLFLVRLRVSSTLGRGRHSFQTVFDNALDAVFIKDREGRYIDCNPAMAKIVDRDRDEIVGLADHDMFDDEISARIDTEDAKVLSGERVEDVRRRLLKGVWRSFHVIKTPLRDEQGEILGVCGIAREVTHQQLLEKQNREATERLQSVLDNIPGAIYSFLRHPEGSRTMLYASPDYAKVLGPRLAEEFLSGRIDFVDLIHPEDRGLPSALPLNREDGRLVYLDEYRLRQDDGSYRWVQARSHGIPQENGDVLWHGILLDIDDRKCAEEALRVSNERLQALAEQLPGAMFTYLRHPDGGMTRLYSSPGYAQILGPGLARRLLSGEIHYTELIHPDDLDIAEGYSIDEATGHHIFNVEYRLKDEAGDYKWVHIRSHGIPQENGDQIWHGIMLDIGERKRAEEELRETSHRLQTLAEQLPGAIYSYHRHPDHSLTRIYSSPGYARLLGDDLAKRLLAGEIEFMDLIHPDDRSAAAEVTVNDETGYRYKQDVYRIRTQDGDYLWVEDHSYGIPQENGDYLWQGVMLDIGERKRMEEDLGRATTQIHALAENLPGALFSFTQWDAEDRTLHYMSPGAEGIIGAEAMARCLEDATVFSSLVHPEDRRFFSVESRRANIERLYFNEEYRVLHPDGNYRWINSRGRGTVQPDGEVLWHGFMLDIDDLKRADDQLRLHSRTLEQSVRSLNEAKLQAELAVKARGQFLANMSHEIRTPLTAVLGFADILDESIHDAEDREALTVIKQNGRHLLRIINDILDLSKIEAGRMELDLKSFDPAQEIRDVVKLMRPRLTDGSLRLVHAIDDDVPSRIEGDPTRLRQILLNLVGNAIKFTERGEVKLRAAVKHPEPQQLIVEVIDTGIGVDPAEVERLFEAFHQADSSTSRLYGGTGLGLTISRHLAEFMGGTLTVGSRSGGGSRFRLTLPLQRAGELEPAREIEPAPLPERLEARILLAEDNHTNQRIVEVILGKLGCRVDMADDGQAALEMERAAREEGRPYDAILMDIQMPVMDGLAATRALRAAGQRLPIIALTAHALEEDRRRCFEAGCDEHVSKPIDRAELLGKLAARIDGA